MPDVLFVQLELEDLNIVSEANFLPGLLKSITIPPQMKLEDADLVQNYGKAVKITSESAMSLTFVENLAFSSSSNMLW